MLGMGSGHRGSKRAADRSASWICSRCRPDDCPRAERRSGNEAHQDLTSDYGEAHVSALEEMMWKFIPARD